MELRRMGIFLSVLILWNCLVKAEGEVVSVHWGLPDSACVVGKLCLYRIPKDAFKGDISRFHVSRINIMTVC